MRRGSQSRADVVVIGGGPAGLAAATMAARCRRAVVVFDAGAGRNAASLASHGVLALDGVSPAAIRERSRAQAGRYGVSFRRSSVDSVSGELDGAHPFRVTPSDGSPVLARRIILATGRRDRIPTVEGFDRFYGRGAHRCCYCDAYEYRDRPIVVHAPGVAGVQYALLMRSWSRSVTLCPGIREPTPERVAQLRRNGVALAAGRVDALEGRSRLTAVRLADGRRVPCAGFFFDLGLEPADPMALSLGCRSDRTGALVVDRDGQTTVPGVYAAGDVSGDLLLVGQAAAAGTRAAIAAHEAMALEDLR